MTIEKRKHSRFAMSCPISFSADDLAGVGKLINLSVTGWRARVVTSTHGIQPGMTLKLVLSLPDNPLPLKFDHAVVRWSSLKEFGVEFCNLGAKEVERLDRIIQKLAKESTT